MGKDRSEYMREYKRKNAEHINAYNRAYRHANPEKAKKYNADYRARRKAREQAKNEA